ncbi:MAG: hypothetical protein IJD04_08685 [Desulfovibrionaceae bacterium]|nr:hypothetical protein [Desulfovibrionaceae bacterium]
MLCSRQIKNILVVHNGALGDFLCAWPGIYSIVRHFEPLSVNFWFYGRGVSEAWLDVLGIKKVPWQLRADIEKMYISESCPAWINDTVIFWFCLESPVALPVHEHLISLPVLDLNLPEMDREHDAVHGEPQNPLVISNIRACLAAYGIVWRSDWPAAWRDLFGVWQGENSRQVGLIPGAGHKAKSWPLENFEFLARQLEQQGFEPVFLLGPAEQERGMKPDWQRVEYPEPPRELAERMLQMRAIIACDGGPAHLASHHAVPGLVLFGPVDWRVWAPAGLHLVLPEAEALKNYPSPVLDPKNIDNSRPGSMEAIEAAAVLAAFCALCGEVLK